MTQDLYAGIDVGTGSVRAALFDARGVRVGFGAQAIQRWSAPGGVHEQSSEDIWRSCGQAVRTALKEAGARAESVQGVGFDATCSLVVLGADNEPVTVSSEGHDEQNVILWMDHRAIGQAARINATGHPALRYVGGTISPEMEMPKLLWLKEHLPQSWDRARRFLDLADFLTFRATGRDTRSLCTTTCKWNYRADEGRWDEDFLRRIGLADLAERGYARIGGEVRPQGELAGSLTEAAADALGLAAGTSVAVALIDAHAGGVGVLGMRLNGSRGDVPLEQRLALIGGSSSCHMAVSREERFVPGVWGPYRSAMIPGYWLAEGGQSVTGTLVDHIVHAHPAFTELERSARAVGVAPYEALNQRVAALARDVAFPAQLTRDFHVYPDFHGNRSPLADPSLRGMICGLTLETGVDALAVEYLATLQAIALGTRHIVETLNRHGYRIDTLIACGGGTKNDLFLQSHADATGCAVVLPEEPEAVLLGAAILGAVACKAYSSIELAMAAMSRPGRVIESAGGAVASYFAAKWEIYRRMLQHQREYAELMRGHRSS